MQACTIAGVKRKVDSTFWSLVAAVITGLAVWQVGTDPLVSTLLGTAGGTAALACWRSVQHLAQWLASGVAAVSGALLTLVMEAAMNGAPDDPSTGPIALSFAGAAAVSGALHNRIARGQAEREREMLQLLATLSTAAELNETERRLHAALEQPLPRSASWWEWWTARPSKR